MLFSIITTPGLTMLNTPSLLYHLIHVLSCEICGLCRFFHPIMMSQSNTVFTSCKFSKPEIMIKKQTAQLTSECPVSLQFSSTYLLPYLMNISVFIIATRSLPPESNRPCSYDPQSGILLIFMPFKISYSFL